MFIARSRASRAFRSCVLAAFGFGLVLVPATLSSPAASAAQASGDPIVIGNVGTYSAPAQGGAGAEVAVGKDAIEAWAKWVNAHGGINTHPVKLIVKDNKNDQAQAVAAVKELVEQENVVAFVSNQDGSLNAGYADYLKEKGIPVLGGSVFTPDPWVSNPMFFPEGLTAIPDISAIIATAKKQGFKDIGSLACAEAPQCELANTLIKSLATKDGLNYAYGGLVSSTAPDYTANCLAAKGAGAKLLVLLIATADLGNKIADDCARQNYKPGWFIPGEAIGTGYLTKAFNNTYNAVGVQPWFSKDPSMKDFHAAMKKYAKGVNIDKADLPMNSVDAWASGLMFQKAVELSGATGVPTTADVLAGLAKFNNETLGGITGGLSYSDPENKNQYCYFTILIKNQKFTLPDGAKPSCVAKT
jgi:branched-chain amino acid transport system substrate-binding protein